MRVKPRVSRRHLLRRAAGLGFSLPASWLVSGCAAPMVPWLSTPAKLHRIGYLTSWDPNEPAHLRRAADFRHALQDRGYHENQNLSIEWRFAEGHDERLPALATDLVQRPVDVIVAQGLPATQAAQQATRVIPIVMQIASDPIAQGVVASLAAPGGNVTGPAWTNSMLEGIYAKWLELLKEACPGITRVGVFWDRTSRGTDTPPSSQYWVTMQTAAQTLGLTLQSLDMARSTDLDSAFEAAHAGGADGLTVIQSPLIVNSQTRIITFAAERRLPAMYTLRDWVPAGGLMAYASNMSVNVRAVATYVDKLLKGAKPADLPIEQPTTFDFMLNLKTAQTLGLTIPRSVLEQATEVIQ